ncbi:MAG: hypothetical protein ACLRNW_15975, partial [Neglectibacter sp.]
MNHLWKKAGALLLTAGLLTSILAGCGNNNNGSSEASKETESKANSSASTSSGAEAGNENFNETGFPIVKEKVNLSFVYVKGPNMRDLNENAMFQKLEETTNVHIDWQYPGGADWGEQKSLLLASGDLPDVFFGSNTLKDMDIMTNLDYFVPLEDYIDKYCTNLQAAYEAEPIMR